MQRLSTRTSRRAPRAGLPGTLRVVVADNSPVRHRELRGILSKVRGVQVVAVAHTFSSALQAVRRAKPALVICDLHLGGGNALELARQVHRWDTEIRVLVISLMAGEIRTVSLSSGADAFVVGANLAQELPAEIARLFPRLGLTGPNPGQSTDRSHHCLPADCRNPAS